jgi:hypothetical protein
MDDVLMDFGDDDSGHDENEAQDVRAGTVPMKPTASEVERHRITHYPYRRWCRECLEGQAVGDGHKASPSEPLYPIIGVDYFYITKDSKFVSKGEEAESLEGAIKCIIMRDRMTKCIFAMVVPQKGVDEDKWVVRQVVAAIEWLGHSKVLIKSDQERALVSLVKEALKDLKVKDIAASDEESAKYESQSNGATEAGVRLVRGSFRTLRLDLERRLGWQIPVDHPIMHWLLMHAAHLYNIMKVGNDGLTPWTRARGRPFNLPLCCFGEQVGFKHPGKGPMANPRGNMGPMWGSGTWLGIWHTTRSQIRETAIRRAMAVGTNLGTPSHTSLATRGQTTRSHLSTSNREACTVGGERASHTQEFQDH